MNPVARASRTSRARRLRVPLLVLLLVWWWPAPASADPAGPTHYRSSVAGLEVEGGRVPAGLEAEIAGGDAFLVLRSDGVAVEVEGYEGEPYLRFSQDGTVEVNTRSPARWLNDARYGAEEVQPPPGADADAPPTWEPVADGGVYAWHDHRVHFMSPQLPSSVDPDADASQPVLDWEVPLTVEGEPAVVRGTLVWLPGPPAALPAAVLVGALAVAALLTTRGAGWHGVATVGVALATGGVGVLGLLRTAPGAEGEPALLVLPVISLVVWAAGAVRGGGRAAWLVPAAALPLLGWSALLFGVLTRPIAPGALGVGALRVLVGAGLAVGVAAVPLLVRHLPPGPGDRP